MSVYVDDPIWPFRGMVMCHLLADTPEELFAMADRIGMPRKYFQLHSSPHFDITEMQRMLAVRAGAIEIDKRKVVAIIEAIRANPEPWLLAARQIDSA